MGNTPSPTVVNGRSSGRDTHGRFTAGNRFARGNPHNQRAQLLRARLLERVAGDDIDRIIEALIAKAKTGDIVAIREVLDRCMGKPRQAIDMDAQVHSAPGYDFENMSEVEIAHVIREGGLELPPGLERKVQLIEQRERER